MHAWIKKRSNTRSTIVEKLSLFNEMTGKETKINLNQLKRVGTHELLIG